MAKNYNNRQTGKKSRNYLSIILIIVFILLCIGLIINIIRYFQADQPIVPVQIIETVINNSPNDINNSPEIVGKTTDMIKPSQAIVMNLLVLVFIGSSFWLLLFLKKFDRRHYFNISNSFMLLSNNRFFYISLIMGIIFAFYIGGLSLLKNIDMNISILISKSSAIKIIYTVMTFILLIENYIKTGFSIPITLARTGIFVTIGLTFIIVGYIIGMILFYIFIVWLVFKVIFRMIDAERWRREEQDRIDRTVNNIVDAFERRWQL
jgi:hypothetical protein